MYITTNGFDIGHTVTLDAPTGEIPSIGIGTIVKFVVEDSQDNNAFAEVDWPDGTASTVSTTELRSVTGRDAFLFDIQEHVDAIAQAFFSYANAYTTTFTFTSAVESAVSNKINELQKDTTKKQEDKTEDYAGL